MDNNKRKRKKKSNFLRKAKHYAKKGNYGMGNLSENDYRYYINIYELMKQEEGEAKELLVQNFLTGIAESGDAKNLAKTQVVSRILDDSLPLGEAQQIVALCQIFSQDLRDYCLDPYGSHVLQTLMAVSLKLLQEREVKEEDKTEQTPVAEEDRQELTSFLNKVGRFVFNNLDEFIINTFGTHVFRSVLETCSGIQIKDSIKMSKKQTNDALSSHEPGKILKVPDELQELLKEIAKRMLMLPDLEGTITYESGSAALQSALSILKETGNSCCSALVDRIVQEAFMSILYVHCDCYDETSNLPLVFQSSPAVRLFEVVISVATVQQLYMIFTKYFKGHMQSLVKHKVGNFAVQKLLMSWQDKGTFHELFEEVKEALPAALEVKYTGIVHALTRTCRKLETSEGQCWKAIMALLRCYEPQERQIAEAPCILWFQNYDEYQKLHGSGNLPPVSLHGALILQEFLQFRRTMKVTNSILAMNVADLQLMSCDPRGSHVIDAFCESSTINIKTKLKLIKSFEGKYVELACCKFGSRTLEAMWKVATIKEKTDICKELAKEELKLKGNAYGTIIYSKFMVRLFNRKDKGDWQERVDSVTKKKKVLDDLLACC